jgi:enterochelin esterase family protein
MNRGRARWSRKPGEDDHDRDGTAEPRRAHRDSTAGTPARGRVVVEWVDSQVLRGNRAGDPHGRRVPVYLPPSYDHEPNRRYPVVFVLTGFMGRGRMLLNDSPWLPSLDDRMDVLIGAGCPETILVMPDCFTRYGGSQYINSSATGRYANTSHRSSWPTSTPATARSRVASTAGRRQVVGRLRRAGARHAAPAGLGRWRAIAATWCLTIATAAMCRSSVRRCRKGGPPWLERFEAKIQKKHEDFYGAQHSRHGGGSLPNPATEPFGIDLPCDLETGAFRDDVWAAWLEHDPMRLVERHAGALRELKALHLDCGFRDEWHLHLGARLFTRRLRELGVKHDYEEFDDGHMNVSYRYDVSLPKLARALDRSA